MPGKLRQDDPDGWGGDRGVDGDEDQERRQDTHLRPLQTGGAVAGASEDGGEGVHRGGGRQQAEGERPGAGEEAGGKQREVLVLLHLAHLQRHAPRGQGRVRRAERLLERLRPGQHRNGDHQHGGQKVQRPVHSVLRGVQAVQPLADRLVHQERPGRPAGRVGAARRELQAAGAEGDVEQRELAGDKHDVRGHPAQVRQRPRYRVGGIPDHLDAVRHQAGGAAGRDCVVPHGGV